MQNSPRTSSQHFYTPNLDVRQSPTFVKADLRQSPTHPSSSSTRRQPMCRRVHLRAHRASRQACLGHACLPACLRHTCLREAACNATIVSSHVVSAHVRACRPVSATPPSPSLLACARYALRYALRSRLREPPRLLEPATLRPCDPVRLCTYAFSAPQEAAHTHGVPSQPSHAWLNPLSPPPSPHAESDFQTLNYKVCARPTPQHGCPVRPHAVPAALACTCARVCI